MEYLIIAVILYFIVQVAGNLVHLLRGRGPGATAEEDPSDRASSHARAPQSLEWGGPSPRAQGTDRAADPRFWGDDIEDATWHDVGR